MGNNSSYKNLDVAYGKKLELKNANRLLAMAKMFK